MCYVKDFKSNGKKQKDNNNNVIVSSIQLIKNLSPYIAT